MNIIARSFIELDAHPCWQVRWGRVRGLDMSFGTPWLSIREPRDSQSTCQDVRKLFAYRNVVLKGDWWLWVHSPRWRLTLREGERVTEGASRRRIQSMINWLDGQRLVTGQVNHNSGATCFEFDLGAIFEVRSPVPADWFGLWSLYRPNRRKLTVRGDGLFSHELSTRTERWRPLPNAASLMWSCR